VPKKKKGRLETKRPGTVLYLVVLP